MIDQSHGDLAVFSFQNCSDLLCEKKSSDREKLLLTCHEIIYVIGSYCWTHSKLRYMWCLTISKLIRNINYQKGLSKHCSVKKETKAHFFYN